MLNIVVTFKNGNLNPVMDSLKTGRENYILLENTSDQRFARIMKEVLRLNRENRAEAVLAVSRNSETKFFPIHEVYYIESFGNLKSIRYREGKFEFYGALKKIEEIMEAFGFIRIHHSYIISLEHISASASRSVVMKDGTRINIGRKYLGKYRKAVRERMIEL